MSNEAILKIDRLKTFFHSEHGVVRAVDDISLQVEKGRTLGIVGESGSGKSVTSLTVMGLLADAASIEGGSISFLGQELVGLPEPKMRSLRGKDVSMIFQEPMTSLNPVYQVGSQVAEAITAHERVTRAEAKKRTLDLFQEVGIPEPEQRYQSYPHQMSGGQKQRVMIAMALACNPQLLFADEPTTALDVTIQAQILELIREMRDKRGMAVIFITHDLGVISEIADEVGVMFAGKLVEYGPTLDIFSRPQHAYTKGLLACRPRLDTKFKRLPTIDDFMDIDKVEGEIVVHEKEVGEREQERFLTDGRSRKLHPKSELAALGYEDPDQFAESDFVEEGERPILEVKNLRVYFPIRRGLLLRHVGDVKAVDDVSFRVYQGQTLGLVGESGCGKTTTGRAILQLIHATAGDTVFCGCNLEQLRRTGQGRMQDRQGKAATLTRRSMHRHLQIIFQDPYGSLNPRMTVESTLLEPMRIHKIGANLKDRRDRAAELLEEVGLDSSHLRRYPHEFSGGQRQRICIARALTVEPEFLICDESVSALDVSVQAQVLNLLNDLQRRRSLTYIFISHDLSVVKFMSDMMAVMNEGKIVEYGPSEAIYASPREDYTRRLIEATPNDDLDAIRARVAERERLRQARE